MISVRLPYSKARPLVVPLRAPHSLHRRLLARDAANANVNADASSSRPDHRASAKLFEDAAREEAAERAAPARPAALERENENWTGDEPLEHAVLRMLVDKYKPLRGGQIRSADEKLRQAPPRVHIPDTGSVSAEDGVNTSGDAVGEGGTKIEAQAADVVRVRSANEPLLPSIEGHKPWHTTFKAPSHATSSVRYGRIPSPPRSPVISQSLDERARKKEKEARKRTEKAGRLSRARESTLDYRLGIKKGGATEYRRPNPVSMKGWASLVEDRIEKARMEGLFKTVKGRGQPLASTTQERNPFIAREEFLMNRIVQRNGAAPPWVEIQGELEAAITSFRGVVNQSWTRRAIRMLTSSQPLALLPTLTLTDVTSLRDAEWEAREKSYHDTALEEVNSLVRKYNGLAPYAVRRPYYMRTAELERVYRDSGEDILRGLAERMQASSVSPQPRGVTDAEEEGTASGAAVADTWARLRIRDLLRDWWGALRGR
ncbi:hypothetical protein BKA93DRAFT_728230 [Sparassis latifolia]